MNSSFGLIPPQASDMAGQVDGLWWFLVLVTIFFTGAVYLGVFVFAVKYRRRNKDERPRPILGSTPLEIIWSVVPFIIAMIIFGWGAKLYYDYASPPEDAMELYVVGRQWMWKVQHPEGQREINELHVPAGRTVRLTMASEDVIHDFFIPAFRIKRDVVPGRYQTLWFTATKPGTYHLFCAEYCGSYHSRMVGWVHVMDPTAYEQWLSGVNGGGGEGSMASIGQKVFAEHGCASCHRMDVQGRGPNLRGLYGQQVRMADGQLVVADETYLRESILAPANKIVYGFQNIMPSFQGQVSEEQLLELIAYIKSLNQQGPQNEQGSPDRQGPNAIQGGYFGQTDGERDGQTQPNWNDTTAVPSTGGK